MRSDVVPTTDRIRNEEINIEMGTVNQRDLTGIENDNRVSNRLRKDSGESTVIHRLADSIEHRCLRKINNFHLLIQRYTVEPPLF